MARGSQDIADRYTHSCVESEESSFNQRDNQRQRSVRRESRSGFKSWCRHAAGTAGAGHRLYGSPVDSADKGSPAGRGKSVRGQRHQCRLLGRSALLAMGRETIRFEGAGLTAVCRQMAAKKGESEKVPLAINLIR